MPAIRCKGFVKTYGLGNLMKKLSALPLALGIMICLVSANVHGQDALWVDFNSTSQDNGPHHHPDYQPYNAGHEVADDFVTAEYPAFGTTVSFTPSWPDTTDNRVMQSIDRGTQGFVDENGDYQLVDEDGFPVVSSHDFTWFDSDTLSVEEDMTGNIDIVTDWIGADTRTGNGGNGDFDGVDGDPTRMLFTFEGIPAGEYNWVSFHHDTEFMHGRYWFDYSVDGGETFQPVGDREFRITKSNPAASNPPAEEFYSGFDEDFNPIALTDLPSTVVFDFVATGDDVVMAFTPLSELAVHTQFAVVNGFQLTQTGVVEPTCIIPEGGIPGDLNGDGEVAFNDFLTLSSNYGATNVPYSDGDIDCNGEVGFPDFLTLSGNFGQTAEAQAVPEPSGFLMALMALAPLGLRRKRD